MLPVENWLKKPQRFRVKTEMIRPDKLEAGTTVKGLDYIDVPGNSERQYKLTFYAHKEGQSLMKVGHHCVILVQIECDPMHYYCYLLS